MAECRQSRFEEFHKLTGIGVITYTLSQRCSVVVEHDVKWLGIGIELRRLHVRPLVADGFDFERLSAILFLALLFVR